MKKLSEVANENDRVLIYFAGHGKTESLPTEGEEGYLVPVEGDKDDLYTTALAMSEMKRISDRVAAKDMLFLMDACYSGLMGVGGRGLTQEGSSAMSIRKIAAGGSRTVITAGRKGEIAQERAQWGHSPFVKNIVSGLEKGMADFNDDAYITGSELGMFLTNQVTADTDNKQTPGISYFTTDRGEFVFILGDINLKIQASDNSKSDSLDYDKLAEKIAEKMSKNNDINESDTLNSNENAIQVSEDIAEAKEDISEAKEDVEEALYDILEMLNDLGIDLEGEEIAKITDDVGDEIKDKIGLTEGKLIANCTFANSQTRYYADGPKDEGDIVTT
ncbi:MAG: caspase family protein, partial [Candidatus Marinimicrobia bacterium]|nr:caspase family protein [Candidatus Neomarinimicrobiota bacterium]